MMKIITPLICEEPEISKNPLYIWGAKPISIPAEATMYEMITVETMSAGYFTIRQVMIHKNKNMFLDNRSPRWAYLILPVYQSKRQSIILLLMMYIIHTDYLAIR